MIPFPKQLWSIERATKRINIWEGAVRSGKTWGSIFRFLEYICTAPKGDLILMGKTTRTAYMNVIRPILEVMGDQHAHYSSGKGELMIYDRLISVVGGNDERAEQVIRGRTCAGAYVDELTLIPESVWTMLLSRLSVKGAMLFASTNPDSPNHWFMRKFLKRQIELDMAVFKFFIDDNIFLDQDYVRQLKREYTGLWYKRFIDSVWCIAEGAVYDFFEEIHPYVTPYLKLPQAKYKMVAIDHGTGNPTAMGLFGFNPFTTPKVWLEKEYYYDSRKEQKQKTDAQYVDDYIKFVGNTKVNGIIVDPAAATLKAEFRERGIGNIIDANNDVIEGIRLQGSMLKKGEYTVCSDCKNSIDEYYGYCWDSKAQDKGIDKPIKAGAADHSLDMQRYLLNTVYNSDSINYHRLTEM